MIATVLAGRGPMAAYAVARLRLGQQVLSATADRHVPGHLKHSLLFVLWRQLGLNTTSPASA